MRAPAAGIASLLDVARNVYGLPRAAAWAILAFPPAGALFLAILMAIPATRERGVGLLAEDRLVENVTTAVYFVAAAVAARLALGTLRSGARLAAIAFAALAVFCFAVGGEEIAWGQRIFDVQTAPLMRAINSQKEHTLHNIRGFQVFNDWLPFALGLGAGVLILGHTRPRRDVTGLPSLLLAYSATIVLLGGYDRITDIVSIQLRIDIIAGKLVEYVEFLVSLGFLLGLWLHARRERRRSAPV